MIKEKAKKKSNKIFQRDILKKILIFLILVFSVTLTLSINFIPSKVELKEGEVATRDIVAPKTTEYIDEEATRKIKEQTARSIREVYNLNLASIEKVEEDINQFFSDVEEIIENNISFLSVNKKNSDNLEENLTKDNIFSVEDLEIIRENYSIPAELDDSILKKLLQLDKYSLNEIEENVHLSVKKIMQQGIKEEGIEEARKQIVREISKISSSTYNAIIAGEVAKIFLKPSLFLDTEATEEKRMEAVEDVRDVKNTIRKDQIIIRKGEIVNTEHIEMLKALGLQNLIVHFQYIIGILLINFLLIFLLSLYIFIFHQKIYTDLNKLILLGIIYLFIIFIAKIIGEISGYLIPLAFASMLVTLTLDSRLALIMTFIISFNIGFTFSGEINYMIVAMAGGFISVFSIRKAIQRSSLTRAGFLIALVNVFSITAIGLIEQVSSKIILENIFWGILNGFVSVILTLGVLPFLEGFFDLTSSFRLMELSNPNQPLLKQLLVEAPGTYHHSVIVGNLAETAAEEIGANSLLTKVGAYYHDIGKLKRPYFFAENQEAYKNTHDDLEPSLSALVIASHVKDGVEIAKKYKLPRAIIDIISQHHANGLISYFYHRALQSNENKSNGVNEENYRYPGPKPQNKEAAIILLADMLEAEARTLNNPTSSRIKNLTQNVINRNLENGQLEDCNLTLKDLNTIKDVFSRILTGMFHNRVEYPEEELINKLKKERAQSEGTNKKSTGTENQST